MDTTRLKRFATEARTILMQGVKNRLQSLGFDLKTGKVEEMPQEMEGGAVFMNDVVSTDFYRRWMSLYNNVQARSIREVAEEAAYTWFNRFMAIRIMEKRGFIAPVLEYESEEIHIPAIVNEATQGRMPQMTESMHNQLMELLDDPSKTAEQFALLIVAYCHDNPIINRCFGAIADYTELLLPVNILSEGGFIEMMNHTEFITEEQYSSAELIGWLYQFYIADRKDEAFAKKGKYDPDEIAPATQIFTPNWIVKYMVQNTVGRIYLDNNPYEDELKEKWKYLVEPSEPTPKESIFHFDDLKELKTADLACGSGHILNEAFDLLYDLYVNEGYSRTEAIKNIFQYNLLGIDIDTRAKQLATFALLMKACQKDESFLDAKLMPRVYSMPRPIFEVLPNYGTVLPQFLMGTNQQMVDELINALQLMNHADTLGSIMKFELSESTRNTVMVRVDEYEQMLADGEIVSEEIKMFLPYMRIILALTDHYAAICMNPPYMGSGRFDATLSKYVKDNYAQSKADLFAVFMDVAIDRLADNGKYGMINMHSWMFLSSFVQLRKSLLDNYHIDSLLHLGPRTFDELSGEVVQNASFVISNHLTSKKGDFFRLVSGRSCSEKEQLFVLRKGHSLVDQKLFYRIPGRPISYWVSDTVYNVFNSEKLRSYGAASKGIITGDNARFLRLWTEVAKSQISFNTDSYLISETIELKWYPCRKGGLMRKWYGNNDYVINWYHNGYEIIRCSKDEGRNCQDYANEFKFKPSISWTSISGGIPSFRYGEKDVAESAGMSFFPKNQNTLFCILGFLNSKVSQFLLEILNPTVNYTAGSIESLPLIVTNDLQMIKNICNDNIIISRGDWDSHETSWDFEANPLVAIRNQFIAERNTQSSFKLSTIINEFETRWEECFIQLHKNEEELNRLFIEIYGLQDELTPDVPLDEITILQHGEITIENNQLKWHDDVVMKQLISYAVGCMMGRYSIDKPGLILANQGDGLEQYNALVPKSRFDVDDDGIVPLMPADCDFTDNASVRFKQWLSVTFGPDTLVENLNFIEKSLGKSIDDYFVKDFWKDHKKMYQNRPIYWLFSSKKGSFQCIAYMHRMNAYTAERIRTKYLLPHIEWLMQKQSEMEANAANLTTQERRQLDNIVKQIEECREYHDRLHVIADQQIAFDLDDGVVVNYAKFEDVLAKIK